MELFEEATKHHMDGNYPEAEKCYDMLLSQNHDNAGLLATIGTLYLQTRRYGMSISLLHRALSKGMVQSDVLSNLSLAYKGSGQTEKAIEYAEKACQQPSPSGEALANYSGFFTNAGTPDKSIELCERALKKDPEMVIAHWNLALALLEKGEWERAWDEHDWGLRRVKNASLMRTDRQYGDTPYWDGTKGKNVVVYGEQGIGDEIMFVSMLPDLLKDNGVVFECHKRLKTLFEHSFPGLPCYGTREDTQIEWFGKHDIHYRVSIGSLGKWFRRSAESFPGTPYLKAESAPKGEKFRVGISWTGGGGKQGRVITRSVPLSWWLPILNNDVELVSLQYTDCAADIDLVEKQGYKIKQYDFMTDRNSDYYETAKVVKSCDLVISVCTSVVHLAGALGVPCWAMVPSKPAWRYGISGGMRWYRSVRLYRQKDSWMPVIERVGYDLSELLKIKQEIVA